MSFPGQFNVYSQNAGIGHLSNTVQQTRAPTSSDVMGPNGVFQNGQTWIDTVANASYTLTSITSQGGSLSATWVTTSGGPGSFTSLTVTGQSTLGATTIVGTTLINASGSANTTIGTGGTGSVTIGNTTGNTSFTGTATVSGNLFITSGFLFLVAAGTGIVFNPVIGATGAGPITAAGRIVSCTFSSVSIAAGATQAFVITNSNITSNSQIGVTSWSGATTGSALSLQSVVNDGTGHTTTFTFTNGTGATTTTANITITYLLIN